MKWLLVTSGIAAYELVCRRLFYSGALVTKNVFILITPEFTFRIEIDGMPAMIINIDLRFEESQVKCFFLCKGRYACFNAQSMLQNPPRILYFTKRDKMRRRYLQGLTFFVSFLTMAKFN